MSDVQYVDTFSVDMYTLVDDDTLADIYNVNRLVNTVYKVDTVADDISTFVQIHQVDTIGGDHERHSVDRLDDGHNVDTLGGGHNTLANNIHDFGTLHTLYARYLTKNLCFKIWCEYYMPCMFTMIYTLYVYI